MEGWLSMLQCAVQGRSIPAKLTGAQAAWDLCAAALDGLQQVLNVSMTCGMVKGVRCFISTHLYLFRSLPMLLS